MLTPLHILTARLLTALTVLTALPAQRDQRYLELAYRQLQEYERENPQLDPERLGAGALEAAALADRAERYVTAGLAQCTGQWGRVDCERMLLAFQRVVLQFPSALPAPLLAR